MEVNENVTYEEAEKDYIDRWSLNAKQHFDDGDYEWLCAFLKKHIGDDRGILEIGCGAGYSTLAFVKNGFNVAAIDTNSQALKATDWLMQKHGFRDGLVTAKYDAVQEMNAIIRFINNNELPVDLVVLCNPGGNLEEELTVAEYKLLQLFGIGENEINQYAVNDGVFLYHKWALIFAACSLSMMMEKKLLIVERGDKKELETILKVIESSAGMRKVVSEFRGIKCRPEGGIPLGNVANKQYWGAALFCDGDIS